MNAQIRKETETTDAQGVTEKRIETVDYLTSAGQNQELRNVQVIHQSHPKDNTITSGGVLENAASSIASTLQSAKDVISKNK